MLSKPLPRPSRAAPAALCDDRCDGRRFYEEICDNVVRFAPVIYGPEQMKGMHGLNENIEISCLPGAVDFYRNLIRANVC